MHDGSPFDNKRYFLGSGGNIYSCDDDGTNWANLRTVSGSTGEGAIVFNNYYYYNGDDTFGRYGPLNGAPAFSDNFYIDGVSNIDQEREGGSLATALGTSIVESSTTELDFVPTRDPYISIQVWVDTVGTGDWTLTLHF